MSTNPSFYTQYTIEDCIGRGAQGTLYRVRHNDTNEILAAKFISLAGITDWNQIKKMEREVEILQSLTHPNIPQSYGLYQEQDRRGSPEYIVLMEYIKGISLAQHITTKTKFTESQLQSIKDQSLEALSYAHQRGIVHRDINPRNLMLTTQSTVHVTDFGLSKILGQETHLSSNGVGTIYYMSPEQLKGNPITPASDYYSLALTLIALASTQERTDDCRHDNPLRKLHKLTHLSSQFRSELESLLHPNPHQRTIHPINSYNPLTTQPSQNASHRSTTHPASSQHLLSQTPSLEDTINTMITLLEQQEKNKREHKKSIPQEQLISTFQQLMDTANYRQIRIENGFNIFVQPVYGKNELRVISEQNKTQIYYAHLKDHSVLEKYITNPSTYFELLNRESLFSGYQGINTQIYELWHKQPQILPESREAIRDYISKINHISLSSLMIHMGIAGTVGAIVGSLLGENYYAEGINGNTLGIGGAMVGMLTHKLHHNYNIKKLPIPQPPTPEQFEQLKPYHGKILKGKDVLNQIKIDILTDSLRKATKIDPIFDIDEQNLSLAEIDKLLLPGIENE